MPSGSNYVFAMSATMTLFRNLPHPITLLIQEFHIIHYFQSSNWQNEKQFLLDSLISKSWFQYAQEFLEKNMVYVYHQIVSIDETIVRDFFYGDD